MPLGDSITRGEDPNVPKNLQNGYRDDLLSKLNRAGIRSNFVGSQENGQGFDNDHEGHGGWTINRIASNVGNWLQSAKPDVILLKIGTNDVGFGRADISTLTAQLGSLLHTILQKRPSAHLIVSSIAPTNPAEIDAPAARADFQQRVVAFNAQIPKLVRNRARSGKNISFANVYGALNGTRNISQDGFHPNNSGYQKMANVFYGALQPVLKNGGSGSHQPGNSGNHNGATGFTSRDGNKLYGSRRADNIKGTLTNELFRGGRNRDILTGGGGADVFYYGSKAEGMDIITDFSDNDRLRFDVSVFGSNRDHFTFNSATNVLSYKNIAIAKLNGVNTLRTRNFLFTGSNYSGSPNGSGQRFGNRNTNGANNTSPRRNGNNGNASNNQATGFTARDGNKLYGSSRVDTITGTRANELFRGGRNRDILTGGGGADVFYYGTQAEGTDTITDFSSNDVIRIDASAFGGGLRAGDRLNSSAASTGTLVIGSNPRPRGQGAHFFFNTQTHLLSFDSDGINRRSSPVGIAVLNGVNTLRTSQIEFI